MPRNVPLFVLSALLALGAASAAQACRARQLPEERIQQPFDAIIIARIETAIPVEGLGADPGRTAWSATARRTAGIKGILGQSLFEIGRTGQSAACDDGQPIAKVGELWALYLQRRPDGSFFASESYPLDWARRVDLRLNGLP